MTFNRLKIFVVSLLFVSPALAVNENAGTSGAAFLQIGAGARPTAMGSAYVGIADDVNAVYFNPAGLSFIAKPELMAMHTNWFEGMNYNFGAFSYPTKFGAFALSVQTLNVADIERRDNAEALTGDFDSTDSAYALSYAHIIGPELSLGITGRYITQKLDSASANTISGDIGLVKKFGHLPFSVGMAARHFGQEIEFRKESDPLPFTIDAGFGANLYRDKLILSLDTKMPRNNDITVGGGAEYNILLNDEFKLSLRGGYNSAITDADGNGMSFGGGITFRHFAANAAWIPLGDLGNTLRYDLHVKF